MNKRIVVEGPDGSGKSTLIQTLLDIYPHQLHLQEGFKHSGAKDYTNWLSGIIYPEVESATVPVHNRLYYSELVYGPILRGSVDIQPHLSAVVKRKLRSDAFLIYCNLSYDQLVKSAMRTEQMEGVLPNLRRIYHAYDDLMGEEMSFYWPEGRCDSYNFSRETPKKIIQAVGEYLNS